VAIALMLRVIQVTCVGTLVCLVADCLPLICALEKEAVVLLPLMVLALGVVSLVGVMRPLL
ncbi:hypothetical protein J0680_24680, partial [Vibrio parahaemolyticus]|uniref:hypothetical protein n=1 Tax=Vibrio parahaemolyticus TaxID=670 RepID=UPI001A8C1C10